MGAKYLWGTPNKVHLIPLKTIGMLMALVIMHVHFTWLHSTYNLVNTTTQIFMGSQKSWHGTGHFLNSKTRKFLMSFLYF